MPLPLPNLDDRRWSDLVEEARALIPLYAQDWTDHNLHDPGITLIELLAWITESDIYRLNQIPDGHKRKFLSLIGIWPNPPQPSYTVLSFLLNSETTGPNPISIPASAEFSGVNALGEETRFRTVAQIDVTSAQLQSIQISYDQRKFANVTSYLLRGEFFRVFADKPKTLSTRFNEHDSAVYFGFDKPLPIDKTVSLFFTFEGERTGADERSRLIAEISLRRMFSDDEKVRGYSLEPVLTHHSVKTVWEFYTGTESSPWVPLRTDKHEILDGTRAFSLDGFVTLRVPGRMKSAKLGDVHDLFYVRCRLMGGSYDAAPCVRNIVMNAVPAEQLILVGRYIWKIAPDAEVDGTTLCPGRKTQFQLMFNDQGEISNLVAMDGEKTLPTFEVLDFIVPDSSKPGELTVAAVELGEGTGLPNQQLFLPEIQAETSSFSLYSLEESKLCTWQCYHDFDATTRTNSAFVFDPANGIVAFGDGEKGRVPPKGAQIYATYDATRAEKGNLPAKVICSLSNSPHNAAIYKEPIGNLNNKLEKCLITNVTPAKGGQASETLNEAIARAFESVNHPGRAVTLEDYETLALKTPGVNIARVKAFANPDPDTLDLAGDSVSLITVMVVPFLPPQNPKPSIGLKQAVFDYLNRRRVIGTHIRIVEPQYAEVGVFARVIAKNGQAKDEIRNRVEKALNRFLDPLFGGTEQAGWPFGRAVYISEVLQVIDEVSGIVHVRSVQLVPEKQSPQRSNLSIDPMSLVSPGEHRIDVEFETL